jgi:hypothetical protein
VWYSIGWTMKSPCPELEWVITNTACESCVCVRVYMCCKHLIANVCVCVYVCMCVFVLYVLLFSFIFVGEDSIDVCNVPGEVTFDKSTSTYQNYFGYLDFHTNCSSVLDVQMLNYDPDYPYTYLSKCMVDALCLCVCV